MMVRCLAPVAALAIGLLVADGAAAQSGAPGSPQARPRLFNPFQPFSFSRLTVNPFGLPTVGVSPFAGPNPQEALAAPASATVTPASDDGLTLGPSIPLEIRPPYRPPVRSPYRPPPRPPF